MHHYRIGGGIGCFTKNKALPIALAISVAHDRAKQEIMECLLATIRVSPGVFSRVGRGA